MVALADAEAVATGRFATDVAVVDAQRLADDSLDHDTPLSEYLKTSLTQRSGITDKARSGGEAHCAQARQIISDSSARTLPVIEVCDGKVDMNIPLGLEAEAIRS